MITAIMTETLAQVTMTDMEPLPPEWLLRLATTQSVFRVQHQEPVLRACC